MIIKTRKTNNTHIPLVVEQHPEDYNGYEFITLIQYKTKHILTIIDNKIDKMINAYVLDYCVPEGLYEEAIITIASEWYENNYNNYPISIEFSKRGITRETSRIFHSYNIEYISRIIGPLPIFNMTETIDARRRRKKPIPDNIEIKVNPIF